MAYRAVNQLDLAIESYTMMIALDPNSLATYEAYNNRGLVYLDKGDFNLAIQDFEMAIKLQPERVFGYVIVLLFISRETSGIWLLKTILK